MKNGAKISAVNDELMRAAGSGAMLVAILASMPLVDKLIYWTGWIAGRCCLLIQKAFKSKRVSRGAAE